VIDNPPLLGTARLWAHRHEASKAVAHRKEIALTPA
jgi:hypothetical protein